nr:hypothetical protein [Bifidobacterium breve]
MFMNLFRRQRPALARLARNSNSYQHPMAKAVNSSPHDVSDFRDFHSGRGHQPGSQHPGFSHEQDVRLSHRVCPIGSIR